MSTSDAQPKPDEQGTNTSAEEAPNTGRSATDPAEGGDDAPGENEGSPRG